MRIRILSFAASDLAAGRDFYEQQQSGLGQYFLDTLFSDIEALLLNAGVHVQYLGYFRALSRRFPYAVYYKMNGEHIEIWRVLDCRENPKRTKTALRG
jgi:plasmid stabilization system protein ParE